MAKNSKMQKSDTKFVRRDATTGLFATALIMKPLSGGAPIKRGESVSVAWKRTGERLRSATTSVKGQLKHG